MKKTKFLIFLMALLTAACAEHKAIKKQANVDCQTLQACLGEIANAEYSKYGLSNNAVSLAKRFPTFGEAALVELVALLKSNDEHTLKLVGYAIAEFDSIDEKHLPAIKSGIEKDVSWLPRALGAIPSAAAAEYAVDIYLRSSSSPSNQEAFAVTKQGERVLPYILARAQCNDGCDDQQLFLLAHIVGEMEPPVKQALSEMIVAKLESAAISTTNKRNLLTLFFKMGEQGRFIEEKLYQIAKENPELGLAINGAYIGVKSKYSGRVVAQYLKESPDIFMLRDVAELGPAARDAGPVMVELLSHSDGYIRLGAARALGYIQYEEAVPALIPLMQEKGAVRLNWAASESLGMLAQPESLDALMAVSQSHWYPAVRESAEKSWRKIKHGEKIEDQAGEDPPWARFFEFEHFNIDACHQVSLKRAPEESAVKLNRSSAEKDKEKLAYDSYVLSYAADDEAEQVSKDPDGVIEINRYNMVERKEKIKQVPDVALKVDGGWLAGSDRGEWGGELVFIADDGKAVRVLDSNVEDIYKLGDKYIVVVGLAHLFSNNGKIYQLQRAGDEWQAAAWVDLPGAPESSWFVETGELLINTIGGGSILVSPEGDMRMATCEL